MESNVVVVIVNYYSAQYLHACISSIQSDPAISRIIVYDNGSDPAELHTLRSIIDQFPKASITLGERNVGFGAGVNRAARVANIQDNEFVWILNPDTVAAHDTATRLRDAVITGQAHIVSPLILTGTPPSRSIWFLGGNVDMRKGVTCHLHLGELVPDNLDGMLNTSFIAGAALMMSAHTWTKLGGFREDFFLYWEDSALSIAAQTAGLRMAVVTSAVVWHAVGGSSSAPGALSAAYYYYNQRNRILLATEQRTTLSMFFGRGAVQTLKQLIRPLRVEKHDRKVKFSAGIHGLLDGLHGRSGERDAHGSDQ